jgi:hypothetical protein
MTRNPNLQLGDKVMLSEKWGQEHGRLHKLKPGGHYVVCSIVADRYCKSGWMIRLQTLKGIGVGPSIDRSWARRLTK